MDKINQLSLGEKLVAGGGVVMLIASFLPWYRVSFLGISVSANGWEAPGALFSILAVFISVALAGAVLASRLGGTQLPALGGFSWGQAYLAGGAVVALLILIKLLNESSSISFGFFLGIIAAGAIAYGGFLLFSEDKGSGFSMPNKQ